MANEARTVASFDAPMMNRPPSRTDLAQYTRDRLEAMLLAGLAAGSPEGFLEYFAEAAVSQGWAVDWTAALTHWGDMCRLGVVAIVGGGSGGYYASRPRFILTERGRRILERKQDSPHDGDRYLAAVRERVDTPDPIAMGYLKEAAAAWRSDLNRASVVMLGAACERPIILLAEAIRVASIPPIPTRSTRCSGARGRPAFPTFSSRCAEL